MNDRKQKELEALFPRLPEEKLETMNWAYKMCEFILQVCKEQLHEEFGFGNKEDGAVLEEIIMLGRRYLKETEFTCTEHKKGE